MRIDAVISSATASVAAACEAQVGQVKTALSHACEAEVRTLRGILAEATAGETERLRTTLSSACDGEMQRVASSLAVACQREVEAVSAQCQSEVERVKQALKLACEQEVQLVREACRREVDAVKEALKEACEAEVRSVRSVCEAEVSRVKADLAEACAQEGAALVSSMERDLALARSKQRRELEEMASPYVMMVESHHKQTADQIALLHDERSKDGAKLRAIESQTLRTSQRLDQLVGERTARDRLEKLDGRLRTGARFLRMRVVRKASGGSSLEVELCKLRLTRDGEAVLVEPILGSAGGAEDGEAGGDVAAATRRRQLLPVSTIASISLGAPTWCCKAAALDLALIKEQEIEGVTLGDEDEGEGQVAADGRIRVVPSWHCLTLTLKSGPPVFLIAGGGEGQAMDWAAGLSPIVGLPGEREDGALMAVEEAGGRGRWRSYYGMLLWRRTRLRLDAKAARGVPSIGGVQGTDTRMGVVASLLLEMAHEEEARVAWVRWHLGQGDAEGARRMGWAGGAADLGL